MICRAVFPDQSREAEHAPSGAVTGAFEARWKIGAVRFSLNKAARPTCPPSRSLIDRLVIPKGVSEASAFFSSRAALRDLLFVFLE
jgi:hypothetical protein